MIKQIEKENKNDALKRSLGSILSHINQGLILHDHVMIISRIQVVVSHRPIDDSCAVSMTTEQTPSTDEDHEMWLKASEKAKK